MLFNKISLFKLFTFVCLLLIAMLFNINKPALASETNFREQLGSFIEEITYLQTEGRDMEFLRTHRDNLDNLAKCGKLMRRFQPQADSIRTQVESLNPTSISDKFAQGNLSAAATSLNLCVSCLPKASGYCDQVSSSIQYANEILNNDEE